MTARRPARPFRSRDWFADPHRSDMTALYLERFMNYGVTPDELRSGRPIIGIAQTGSDLSPCNRIHLELAQRVRDGIRDAGGIPMEYPVHPIFENCRRPTAALDRNLSYLGQVEIMHGYPIDAVVLTTGCDKTTPAGIMAATTVDIPAIVLSGGPMLDGWHDGELVGSGTVIWRSRRKLAAGEINEEQFLDAACASAPSAGHCNTMGTASTMNAVAEALGMSLPGCAAIPAPYRERGQMAYETGRRIVEMAYRRPAAVEDPDARRIPERDRSNLRDRRVEQLRSRTSLPWPGMRAFGSSPRTGCAPTTSRCSSTCSRRANTSVNASTVPAACRRSCANCSTPAGSIGDCMTVTGTSVADNVRARASTDRDVIRSFNAPLRERAGFLVLKGNLFDFAIMKTSVISDEFRSCYLAVPGREGVFEGRAIVFDGSDDYHARINDPALGIDEHCILVIRGSGPLGWPGSAEVVNMQPPDALIRRGIMSLPTLGDGRQSGTSDSPSILNASPESAAGGGLAWLATGDTIRIDLNRGRCDALVDDAEIARRRGAAPPPVPASQTPWEELYREKTGQLGDGAVLEFAVKYRGTSAKTPRHNH